MLTLSIFPLTQLTLTATRCWLIWASAESTLYGLGDWNRKGNNAVRKGNFHELVADPSLVKF